MSATIVSQPANSARSAIMHSIRQHLAQSEGSEILKVDGVHARDRFDMVTPNPDGTAARAHVSPVAMFSERLEAVGGHCLVVRGEHEAATALNNIIAELPGAASSRIALSDALIVQRLVRDLSQGVKEIAVTPESKDLFKFDVGITTAQIAIAETGTLVLESDSERHRLVSLVPPVHIAIVEARNMVVTLGEALNHIRRESVSAMSRAITFITGPSRTADIELTLAIGVHGPKELYVIIVENCSD